MLDPVRGDAVRREKGWDADHCEWQLVADGHKVREVQLAEALSRRGSCNNGSGAYYHLKCFFAVHRCYKE